jgi:quercetin dioxygenase-like cupin family protein
MNIKTLITAAFLSLVTAACGPQSGEAESAFPAARPGGAETAAVNDSLTVTRAGSRSVDPGPAEWFTGTVRIEPLFAATDSSRAAGASVSFEPGARTAWHRHPRGQVLVVTAGAGLVQRRGGCVEEIREGDVIWTPPDVEHWHGAAPTTPMTHIAIHEHADGNVVTWLEKVTDAQYDARARSSR